MEDSARRPLVRAAILATGVSVAWALAIGIAAVISGTAAHSAGLVGLGLESMIDGTASAVLVWRFRVEQHDPGRAQRVELVATRLVSTTLLIIAAYIAALAIRTLVTRSEPSDTTAGLVVAAGSALVLPVLAVVKLRLAAQLHSRALRGDGVLTAAGGILAGTVMVSLAFNDAYGWWWSDALVALLISGVLALEGWHSRRTQSSALRPRSIWSTGAGCPRTRS